jgi:flagellar assembly factor FliW
MMQEERYVESATLERTIVTNLPRFGECTYLESEVISFPWGLPGFAQLRRFLVLQIASQGGFIWLQSLDDVKIALPLGDPWSLFEDYDPRLPAYAKVALDLGSPEDFVLLCVVVVTENAEEMSMNLMAPIVINLKTRTGRQVMLENSEYTVRTPVPRVEASRFIGASDEEEGEALVP